ncbi:hypothetical protein YC2023_035857 [Brassica napus]
MSFEKRFNSKYVRALFSRSRTTSYINKMNWTECTVLTDITANSGILFSMLGLTKPWKMEYK